MTAVGIITRLLVPKSISTFFASNQNPKPVSEINNELLPASPPAYTNHHTHPTISLSPRPPNHLTLTSQPPRQVPPVPHQAPKLQRRKRHNQQVPNSDLDLNTRFAPTTPTKQRLCSVDSAPTAVWRSSHSCYESNYNSSYMTSSTASTGRSDPRKLLPPIPKHGRHTRGPANG